MNVEDFIDELYEILEKSWSLPLSGGKTVVDSEKVTYLLDKIKSSLPNEIKQARLIVSDRTDIIDDAKHEAETIIRAAEDKVHIMLDHDEMVKQAKSHANDIVSQAQIKAKEIKKAANDYVDEFMKSSDEALTANLVEFRKIRHNLKAAKN